MILERALVGGTIYLDYEPAEMALPEADRVAFDYGPISMQKRIELVYQGINKFGYPNPAAVCKAAIDDLGKKIRNLKAPDGEELDSIEKLLACKDGGKSIAYMITIVGRKIWDAQDGEGISKN